MVAANLSDGVFERWHKTLDAKVAAERAKPGMGELDKAQLTAQVRQLAQGEEMPVAVLSPKVREAMGVLTQVVKVYCLQLAQTGRQPRSTGL